MSPFKRPPLLAGEGRGVNILGGVCILNALPQLLTLAFVGHPILEADLLAISVVCISASSPNTLQLCVKLSCFAKDVDSKKEKKSFECYHARYLQPALL